MLTLLSSMSAWGFGGSFAGPVGEAVPTGGATQIVVAPGAEQNVVIVTAQVSIPPSDLALILPVPGIVPGTAAPVLTDALLRVEAFTAPRVEELTCDELVDTFHWESPPGCASFDPERVVEPRGEDAVDAVFATPNFSGVTVEVVVITPEELTEFLDVRGLALDPAYAAALQPHLDRGEPLLTIHPTFPLAFGEWLPPVRFTMAAGEWALPLTIGDAAGVGRHELIVYTVGAAGTPSTPSLGGNSDDFYSLGYPSATVQSDCVLDAGMDASEWLEAERAAIAAASTVPSWVLEYDGPADRCAPCSADPLFPDELSVLGSNAPPDQTRLSRLWFGWDPGSLAEDPVLRFGPAGEDVDLRFLLHEDGLSAVYPPCGASQPDPDSQICENVRLPSDGSGCDAPRSGVAPLAGVALVAALLSRRRRRLVGPIAALLLVVGGSARAAPHDGSPRTEVQAGVSVIGTDRLVPTGLDRGAPWLANPYVGLEVRRTLYAWKDGRTVGVMGALRGFAGNAAPWGDRGVVSFVVAEPTLSLDVRHGKLREASPCWFGRYGADAALAIVDPSVSPAHARLTGGLHGGVGAWLGRGTQRTSLEIRGTVFPRTDGYETTYDPNLGFSGFMFYPGTVNLWLLAGRVFY